MKVRDLIKKLQYLDPESTVCLGEETLLPKETSCHYREYYKTKTKLNFIHKNIFISSNEDMYINNTNIAGNCFSNKEKLKKLLSCWQNDLKEREKIHKERSRENAYYFDRDLYKRRIQSLKKQYKRCKEKIKTKNSYNILILCKV